MNRKTLIRFAHLGKQIACFIASLQGEIMTSVVVQFVRLVASFTSFEKVVNCNRKVIC